MSFSVDDLVSSFSANHIGQEALDLAALQAQLAQSILYQPPMTPGVQGIPRKNSYIQPCNTPNARTPSTSSYQWDDNHRRRSSSIVSRAAEEDIQEMEDDLMVEDILGAPALAAAPQRALSQPLSPRHRPNTHPFTSPSSPDPSQSLFVSTDPFYIAAAQAASYRAAAPSYFSQMARPAPSSPFMTASSQAQSMYSHPMEEARPVLVTGGQSMYHR
ncbi:hypothetical protein BV25DRAFT_1818058 [Artomyces pyxidatus]|uniref:Uncharacterized protein n=1 Tax=Artomyces pyxidatus TaxID=48021 RepID=A0ACB8TL37_9AGAM|nr:hypothetical protein BV25DRAFT_1818058 [Artomyces pyxidatus]